MSSAKDFSAKPSPALLARVRPLARVLMQVRFLLAAITVPMLAGRPLSAELVLAVVAALFTSWLSSRHWDRISGHLLRHPLLIGLDVVASFALLELAGPLGPFFLFTVVTSAVAGLLYRWRGVTYVCCLQVLCYFAALAAPTVTDTAWSFQAVVGQPAYYPLMGFVGVSVRRLLERQVSADEARRDAEVVAAAAEERSRLAREMHDSLAKSLRGVAMAASALPQWVTRSPDRAADEARRLASAAEIASRQARDLIDDLRTDQLRQPLAETLREVAGEWGEASGVAVTVEVTEQERARLGVLARYEAVAICKEALANVGRHAGAGSVRVVLRGDGGSAGGVELTVTDDGSGFDASGGLDELSRAGHYGLIGMRERAARAGGTLDVHSTPAGRNGSVHGTTITARFPAGSEETGAAGASSPNGGSAVATKDAAEEGADAR